MRMHGTVFFTGTIGLRKGPRERVSSLANVSVDTLLTGTCSRRLHMPLARAHAMSAGSMNSMYYYRADFWPAASSGNRTNFAPGWLVIAPFGII